jgi:hypothetical protein
MVMDLVPGGELLRVIQRCRAEKADAGVPHEACDLRTTR